MVLHKYKQWSPVTPMFRKAACVCRHGKRFMMLAPGGLPVCRTCPTPRTKLRRSFLLALLSSSSTLSFYFRIQIGSTSGAWVVLIEPFATNRKPRRGLDFCSLLFYHKHRIRFTTQNLRVKTNFRETASLYAVEVYRT